jgi:hypothetical protein
MSAFSYSNCSLTRHKILRHGTNGLLPVWRRRATDIALKNPSSRPGFNPRTLGLMASTLTITPPRRLAYTHILQPFLIPWFFHSSLLSSSLLRRLSIFSFIFLSFSINNFPYLFPFLKINSLTLSSYRSYFPFLSFHSLCLFFSFAPYFLPFIISFFFSLLSIRSLTPASLSLFFPIHHVSLVFALRAAAVCFVQLYLAPWSGCFPDVGRSLHGGRVVQGWSAGRSQLQVATWQNHRTGEWDLSHDSRRETTTLGKMRHLNINRAMVTMCTICFWTIF